MQNPWYTYDEYFFFFNFTNMTNTWYASDWDQPYRPSYARIRRTVVRHIQVHLQYIHTIES